jgi:two-component system cell cycle response regulator
MDQLKQRLEQSCVPWRLLAVFSLLSLVLWGITIIRPFPSIYTYFYGTVAVLYPLLAGLLCFQGMPTLLGKARPGEKRGGRRFSPALLGLGILCFTCGQIIWVSHLFITHSFYTFPSITHVLYYSMYICFFYAILLLPERGLSTFARVRILFDSLIIMVALSTLCVYFLLAPMLLDSHTALFQKIAGSVFPGADLGLMFCLLLVALRGGEANLRPVLFLLELAVLLIFIRDLMHLGEIFRMAYQHTSPGAVLWLPALFLITGAAQTLSRSMRREPARSEKAGEHLRVSWKTLFSPPLVLILSIVFVIVWRALSMKIFLGQVTILFIGGFLLLMLVVLRQLLAVYEVAILQRRLQERNQSLHLLNARLGKQATTDPLTGLPNHRALVERLDIALAKAQATHASCALIFIDIDRFKTVNDRYGHVVGDQVLSRFGKLVQESLPAGACVGRWGGEEFVALLPHSASAEALTIAERIRARVDRHRLTSKGEMNVTCSLGVASYPQDASTREGLLMSADKAMYAAKRLGRNQVRLAHEPLVLALGMSEAEPEPPTGEEAEMLAVVDSLLTALEMRDDYTSQHSRRVSALSLKLALMLGLSGAEACVVSLGGLLHDLGKIGVPDDILLKESCLTDDEYACMAQHPLTGAEIVAQIPHLQAVAAIVRAHHEHMDGSGYPAGLRGEEIPLGARIVAVADAYDAQISNRAYHSGCAPIEAIRELLRGAGTQFDPQVVGMLVRLFSVIPHLSEVKAA